MPQTFTDHEIRQLDLMKRSLAFFRNGEMDLSKLLNSLRDHFLQLEDPDEKWDDKFRVEWRKMDKVRNELRDDAVQMANVHMRDDMRDTVTRMANLVADACHS